MMAKVLTDEQNLKDIAGAIRNKLDVATKFSPSEMADAIRLIEGYPEPFGSMSITENGVANVKDYEFADVNVQVELEPEDEGKVVSNGELVEQGSLDVYHNGPYDTTLKNSIWVAVANSYDVEDLGKVVAQVGLNRKLVAQTGTTVTENGTYDTTTNDEVIVNVSGGGGGVVLMSKDNWDALSGEQKKAYGLVAVQSEESGYVRGTLVNGADYPVSFDMLPYSATENIICSATSDNYNSALATWGEGTNPVILSAVGSAKNSDGSVAIKTKTDGTLAYVDLGNVKKPFTAYIVAKIALANSSYTRLLSAMAERTSGMGVLLYGSSQVNVSSWGSDTGVSPSVNPNAYFVGMIQYNGATGAKGAAIASDIAPSLISKSPYSAGRYVTIGRTDKEASTTNAEPTDLDVLYFGVTNVYEDETVVAGNMRHLAQELL